MARWQARGLLRVVLEFLIERRLFLGIAAALRVLREFDCFAIEALDESAIEHWLMLAILVVQGVGELTPASAAGVGLPRFEGSPVGALPVIELGLSGLGVVAVEPSQSDPELACDAEVGAQAGIVGDYLCDERKSTLAAVWQAARMRANSPASQARTRLLSVSSGMSKWLPS